MRWDDLRYFLAVARSGSLTLAAASTGTSPQTVARRIEALETETGGALFVRSQAGYALTELGGRLLPQAETVEEACATFCAQAAEQRPELMGTVRLATTDNLANYLLMPALGGLQSRHPELRIELVTGPGTVGLSRREADVALRLTRPDHGNLVVQRLGRMAYGVYAAPIYLQAVPLASSESSCDAPPRQYIVWDDAFAHLPAARWLEQRNDGRKPALVTSSLASQRAAAAQGVGMALLPCFMVQDDPALQRINGACSLHEELWLAAHANLATTGTVRAVMEAIRSAVAAAESALLGIA